MQLSLNELTLNNIGRWPLMIRGCVLFFMFALTVCFGWQLCLGSVFDHYQHINQSNEALYVELKQAKEDIQNIKEYEQQIISIKEKLDFLERQLPDNNDTAGVLEALSQHAAICNLQFKSIKPGAVEVKESYHEQALELSVIGNYHGFGKFSCLVANMPRCITIHDLSIMQDKTNPEKLDMTFIARIYWRPKQEPREF